MASNKALKLTKGAEVLRGHLNVTVERTLMSLSLAASLAVATLTSVASPADAAPDKAATCKASRLAVGESFRVRGRLYAADGGGSGYRIWLVGTKRVVWVSGRVDPPLPAQLEDAFVPFGEVVYGDFTLQALAADRPGHMREVCIVDVERYVVRPAGQRR